MTQPSVTVAIPVLNEGANLRACLDAVVNQTYENILEILVVDGGSTDDTIAIAKSYSSVRILENPLKNQAAGLNIALREASGEIFVRVDGHGILASDYVASCVNALTDSGAAMVGGFASIVSTSRVQAGIAKAMESGLGWGFNRYDSRKPSRPVASAYIGSFRTDIGRLLEDMTRRWVQITMPSLRHAFLKSGRSGLMYGSNLLTCRVLH